MRGHGSTGGCNGESRRPGLVKCKRQGRSQRLGQEETGEQEVPRRGGEGVRAALENGEAACLETKRGREQGKGAR